MIIIELDDTFPLLEHRVRLHQEIITYLLTEIDGTPPTTEQLIKLLPSQSLYGTWNVKYKCYWVKDSENIESYLQRETLEIFVKDKPEIETYIALKFAKGF